MKPPFDPDLAPPGYKAVPGALYYGICRSCALRNDTPACAAAPCEACARPDGLDVYFVKLEDSKS